MNETVFVNKTAAFIFWHKHIGQKLNRPRLISILDALNVSYNNESPGVIAVSYDEASERKCSVFLTNRDNEFELAKQLKDLLVDAMAGVLHLDIKNIEVENESKDIS